MHKFSHGPIPVSWSLESGWLLLLPSRLPNLTESKIELPESFTKKQNQGICIRISENARDSIYEYLLGKELLFQVNQDYRILDTDLDQEFIIINADHIIMYRNPPRQAKFVRVSREEGEDVAVKPLQIATLQPSIKR